MIKFVFKWCAIVLLGVPFSLYILLVLINLSSDEEKSPLVLEYENFLAEKSKIDPKDNAFVYFMGITARPEDDFYEVGLERVKDRTKRLDTIESISEKMPIYDDHIKMAPTLNTILTYDTCSFSNSIEERCIQILDEKQGEIKNLLEENKLFLERYQTILNLKHMYEIHPKNTVKYSGLAYQTIFTLHRLNMLDILYEITNNPNVKLETIRVRLEQEGKFIRNYLSTSNTMISKMIAIGLTKEYFNWTAFILSEIQKNHNQNISITNLTSPLTEAELSFDTTLIGEWQFARGIFDYGFVGGEQNILINYFLIEPFYKRQSTLNLYAETMRSSFKKITGEEPQTINKSPCNQAFINSLGWYSFNPIGKIFSCVGDTVWEDYFDRTDKLQETQRNTIEYAIK